MKLLSLLGLDARLQRLRVALDEGLLATEDRLLLARLAWIEEKQRLKWLATLALAVLGLTLLAVVMLSAAVIVHFWDTPQRITAAWSVAGVWLALWAVAVLGLLATLRDGAGAFAPTRRELARDWHWLQARLGTVAEDEPMAPHPPVSQEALLARIEAQRARLAEHEAPAFEAEAPVPSGSAGVSRGGAVLALARAHPVASGVAAAGVVAVLGPRRLLRWAGWLVPLLLRSR